jgi:hypothetical protein
MGVKQIILRLDCALTGCGNSKEEDIKRKAAREKFLAAFGANVWLACRRFHLGNKDKSMLYLAYLRASLKSATFE